MNSKKITKLTNNLIVNAGFWSIGGHGLGQFIRLFSNLIMTRLLVPDMFGVMAIANVLMVGLALFSDIGLRQNIIRSKRFDDPVFLNTVWSIQIIRGILIWIFSLIISAVFFIAIHLNWLAIGTVYSNPLLPGVIAAISFTSVISGFESTRIATAERQFDQKRIILIAISSQLVGLVAMLTWVSVDRSIWALVSGSIAGSFTHMVLSHTILSGIPNRWEWDPLVVKDVLNFGKWIFLSSIIGFLFNNGDRLLLGGMISAEMLGIYSLAFMMINVLQMLISKLNASVVFPALSQAFHDNNQQLKKIYYKFRIFLDAGILFLVGFLVIAGDVIIDVLYDARYTEAGSMLKILSLVLIAQRYSIADQYYLAIGKPKLMTFLIVIRTLALYIIIPFTFFLYGLYGALWGIVISHFISIPASFYLKAKYNLLDIKKEIIVLPMFIVGVGLGLLI